MLKLYSNISVIKHTFIALIVNSVSERKVKTVVFSTAGSDVTQVSCAGEVLAIFVK